MNTNALMASTLLCLSPFASALAQVPHLISYQGQIAAQGTNFDGTGWFKFALVSGATNTAAQATASATVVYGFVVQITVTDQGAGYTAPPDVSITDPAGSGSTAVAQLSGGRVTGITVLDAGSGYATPTVTIAPPPGSFAVDTYWSNDGTSNAGGEPEHAVAIGVSQGLFSVMLGNTNLPHMQPILPSVFNHSDVRLRVWFSDGLGAFVQLAPDQRISAVGYAMVAGSVPNSSITAPKLADASITTAKLTPIARQELSAPAGSIVLSDQPDATNLVAAGYSRLPNVQVSPDEWEQLLPQPPLQNPTIYGATFVWTGTEVIMWGGYSGQGFDYNTGARYHVISNSWSLTSTQGVPTPRFGHSAAWTGSELLVWGGSDSRTNLNTGGRYNPASDSWQPMSVSNAPSPRQGPSAVWTGTEMIIWGGVESGMYTNTGARYNPATNSWIQMSSVGAPIGGSSSFTAWTGTEMIACGWVYNSTFLHFRLYDPASNTWRAMNTNGAPAIQGNECVWTGIDLIARGSRYRPSEDAWYPISPPLTGLTCPVWTGREVIGVVGEPGYPIGRYDPSRDSWTSASAIGKPSITSNPKPIWTGTEILCWGSGSSLGFPYRYKPSTRLYLYQKL